MDSPAAVVVTNTRALVDRKVRCMWAFVNMDFGIKKESSTGTTVGAAAVGSGGAEAISAIKRLRQQNNDGRFHA